MRFKYIKKNISTLLVSAVISSLSALTSCVGADNSTAAIEPPPETKWTIMYYGDADCNLEEYLMADLAEMKAGIVDGQGVNVIALVDRIGRYSSDASTLNQDFTDTRLFRITSGKAWRIGGSTQFPEITKTSNYEGNMGDPETLKKFIDFCKANYHAGKYALILSNHGGGSRKKKTSSGSAISDLTLMSETLNVPVKNICEDVTSGGDYLYTAEISDTLTNDESVDLFGLDACLMSSVEFAYQFRNDLSNSGFKAEIMAASAPSETGYGWDYTAVLDRLQNRGGDNGNVDITLGGNEKYYNPSTLTTQQLGAIIVEEQRDSTEGDPSQSLTCLDLSKVSAVKIAVDAMAKKLSSDEEKTDLENLRGNASTTAPTAARLHYFNDSDIDEWTSTPFFDLYDLACAINNSADFSSGIKDDAGLIKTAADDFVLYSFANSEFPGFLEGQHGVHIFFPDGDYQISKDVTNDYIANPQNVNLWWWQDWYNAIDIHEKYSNAPLGKLAWCIDGAAASDGVVDNWFELLDKWYDTQTIGSNSNFNYYSY